MTLHVSKIIIVLFICFFQNQSFGQENFDADLVIIKNEQLLNLLNNIIISKNSCSKENSNIVWSLDIKKKEEIILSQSRIPNLIEISKIKGRNVGVSIINNQLIFILYDEPNNLLFKPNLKIELNSYKKEDLLLFEEFSAWLISIRDNTYYLASKKLWECNN